MATGTSNSPKTDCEQRIHVSTGAELKPKADDFYITRELKIPRERKEVFYEGAD